MIPSSPWWRTLWQVSVVLCSLALVVSAMRAEDRPLPPHPTSVFAEYGGKRLPVVAAVGEKPVVIVDGKRRTLDSATPLSTQRNPRYLPGGALIDERKLEEKRVKFVSGSEHERNGYEIRWSVTVSSDQDLPDCYLLMISFTEDSLTDPSVQESTTIRVRELGSVKAGVPTQVEYTLTVIPPIRYATGNTPQALDPQFYTVKTIRQLFSGGNEVRIALSEDVPRFYRHRELAAHKIALEGWIRQNPTGSKPARPVLQIPPLLESVADLPRPASALLTIGPNGQIAQVKLEPDFPEAAEKILSSTLYAWLFMPSIKDGHPVASRVRVPLSF